MRQSILTDLFNSKELANLLNKMHPEHLRDDLKQELFLVLCELDNEKLMHLHFTNSLRFYATRIVLNMIASNTSPFYKKFRQFIAEYNEQAGSIDTETLSPAQDQERLTLKRDQYTNLNETQDQETQHTALLDAVNQTLDGLPWYDKNLFTRYVEEGSAGKLIKKMKDTTGHHIPRRSILNTVKRVKEHVRKEVKVA